MKITAIAIAGLFAASAATFVVRGPSKPAETRFPLASASEPHQARKPVLHPVEPEHAEHPARLAEGIALLERGRDWLATIPDYTATLYRHERVQGELRDPETTELKLRHEPFSVTMIWIPDGKTAHYLDGHNSNRVAVRLGGWKRRLGWINLNPDGSTAMAQSRYAITDVGLKRLAEQLLEKFGPYVHSDGVQCVWLPDEQIGGRACRVLHVEYASAEVNPEYRQSTVWLDREWNVPLSVRNTDWDVDSESNPDGLVELYVYEDVRLHTSLTDRDFSVDAPPTNVATAK